MNPLLVRARAAVPLANAYTGRANSFGFLRLCFALAVVLAHTAVLGYGHSVTTLFDVPGLAVAGFFGISGFLITRSARRSSVPRYLWHRALRILPGLWGCLLFTGLVVAPWLWHRAHGSFHGLWRTPGGVVDYLQNNWWSGSGQVGILNLLTDTPYGLLTKSSVFNGSLWTLSYEMACYLIVAILAALMILRNARSLLLVFGVLVFGVLVWNQFSQLRFGHAPVWADDGAFNPFPVLGVFMKVWFLRYGFMFLMGALAELYSEWLPINDLLGVASLVIVVCFAVNGALFGPALLFYEYVILWLAVRLPRVLHRVGQTNDYSYGIYIYAFVLQQVLTKFGAQKLGLAGLFAVSAISASVCAYVSWHVVEKQALKLKNWTPRRLRADVPAEAAKSRTPARAPHGSPADPGHLALPEPIGP